MRETAENLAWIRKVLKPTITELAHIFGVSRQAVYDWQAGKPTAPENAARLDDLAKAADALVLSGITSSSQLLRRKIAGGKSLRGVVRKGGSAANAAQALAQTLGREAKQPVYHAVASALLGQRIRTPGDVFAMLKGVYVADEKFQQDFARLSVGTRGQRKRVAKYILARLEQDASGRACDPDSDPGSIEHILPENPPATWEVAIAREHWDAAIYRLGNLTLLESAVNRRIGNAAYAQKLTAYENSGYTLTTKLVQEAPEEWTLAHLDARQSRMAQRAARLWRSDFVPLGPDNR